MKFTLKKQEPFHGMEPDIYEGSDGNVYMTRCGIGNLLEYKDPENAIRMIHERHPEEISPNSRVHKLCGVDGRVREHYLYNEDAIYEIIRWSRQPRATEFYRYVRKIMNAVRKDKAVQQALREAGINVRRNLTDTIKEVYEDSRNKHFQYKNYTDLIYKHVLGKSAKELRKRYGIGKNDNLRDCFTAEELKQLHKVEEQVSTLLEMGMSYDQVKGILAMSKSRTLERKRERNQIKESRKA